jgi:hypothetical protein
VDAGFLSFPVNRPKWKGTDNMHNIVADAAAVKLEEEAEIIRRECTAADEAGLCRIDHAMEAGKHANQVKDCIPRRFGRWLRDNGLKRTTVYDYMLLARNEESVRRSGHCSIAGALRMLRAKSGKTPRSKTAKPKETLARHWKRENELARTTFLDEIGIDQFRMAMSLIFYRRLRDLVRTEKTDSNPDNKGTILLKKALSHIRAADAPCASETAAAADISEAAACLRMLLKALGNEPTHAIFGISITATKKRKAAA